MIFSDSPSQKALERMMTQVKGFPPRGSGVMVLRRFEYALKCGTAPVVPHFYALCLNDDIPSEREIGLSAGMSLLWFCDELWIFGDEITEGMRREIDFCKNLNIKTRAVKDSDIKKVLGG